MAEETEFFTARGNWPARIVEEDNADKELSPGEKAMISRMAAKQDTPAAPRVRSDESVVKADVEALRRLSDRTNRYSESADHGDVVG